MPSKPPSPASHFYPRSPCGERPGVWVLLFVGTSISIHALLAESDSGCKIAKNGITISIHALLAESDAGSLAEVAKYATFLSTLSLRRATSSRIRSSSIITYFYPRSPCGERHMTMLPAARQKVFLSTLSLRRATGNDSWGNYIVIISIHALLAESDQIAHQ